MNAKTVLAGNGRLQKNYIMSPIKKQQDHQNFFRFSAGCGAILIGFFVDNKLDNCYN